MADPEWEEDALSAMLDELDSARAERFRLIRAPMGADRAAAQAAIVVGHGERAARNVNAHIERVARLAAEIAGVNTLLHWGWVKDEHLTRIGQQVLERAGMDEEPS